MSSGFYVWSQTAASNATADSSINWQEGQAPSSVNDSARAMMAATAKYRDDTAGAIATGGSSTAYTLTSYQVFDTLAHLNGQVIAFTPHITSGAAPTLNVDGLGAKFIRNATGVTIPTGALLSGSVYRVTYNNSSGEFLIDNQPGILPTNSVTTVTIADANVTLAKIVNTAASRLLGNPTGSAAAPSEISLGAGLSFSGTTIVATLDPAVVPGFLSGLTLSTAGSTGTFGITAGVANASNNTGLMSLSSNYTKTTSSWAVGSGNGALDTGSIAINTWYHVFLIKRIDTGVVDVLFSTSDSAPTLPTNYTLSRRIGSMKTNASSQWIVFTQIGDTFIWQTSVTDLNSSNNSGSRTAITLTVPLVSVLQISALFRAQINATGAGSIAAVFTSLTETDQATPADLVVVLNTTGAGSFERIVSATSQIGFRTSSTNGTVSIFTYGWKDIRGK